jgi:hypothetical protein
MHQFLDEVLLVLAEHDVACGHGVVLDSRASYSQNGRLSNDVGNRPPLWRVALLRESRLMTRFCVLGSGPVRAPFPQRERASNYRTVGVDCAVVPSSGSITSNSIFASCSGA